MKTTVEYKGKQVTVDIPDAELEKLITSRTGYELAELGEPYFYMTASVTQGYDYNNEDMDSLDVQYYAAADYCTDERLARDNARADTLMRQLRRYAAEHGGIPSVEDWRTDTVKWRVGYNYPYTFVEKGAHRTTRDAGVIYFCSQEACEAAMREFEDELVWYFTEYEGQVRE